MARPDHKGNYANLLRFYGVALPYWKTILVSLAAMFVYAAVSINGVLMIKPFVGAFRRAEAADGSAAAGEPVPAPGADAEQEQERSADVFEKGKAAVRAWFLGLKPVKHAVDWLWTGNTLRKIAFLVAFLIGPLFLVSGFLQQYARGRVAWSVLADLRMSVFDRLSSLSLSYFSGQRTGELISRLTNDIAQTKAALKIIFGKLILEPLMVVVFFLVALWASPHLTLIVLIGLPLLTLIMGRYGRRIRRYATKTLEKLADVTDSVTQVLNGIRVVKSFNMEDAEREEFRARNRAQLQKAFKLVRNQAWASVLPLFFLIVAVSSLVLLAADYLLSRGLLKLDDMTLFLVCVGVLQGQARRLVKAYNDLQESIAGVNRIFELIDTQPEIEDRPDAVDLDEVKTGISFRKVSFAYDEVPVLREIDLHVPCGKIYALVGETGAGKSTMLDLIPRFYDPTEGSVTIDGVDVRNIKRESLMRLIAIVGQHPFLFNRPLAENIRYGKPDATDEEVYAAARAANIHDFVLSLPEGYGTLAGEAGHRLSGGQRQCITIARAILKNAPILILDEATSSLDAESERLVQKALNNLMADRTTFVIAHRLSTVRHADRIIVLKNGRIVEQGTHKELLEEGGEYERLYRLQFADDTLSPGRGEKEIP